MQIRDSSRRLNMRHSTQRDMAWPVLFEQLERRLLFYAVDVVSGEYVHQWIANEAASLISDQYGDHELLSHLGSIGSSDDDGPLDDSNNDALDVGNEFLEGVYEEDKIWRWMAHFVAGGDGVELTDGLAVYDSAYTHASETWQHAVAVYETDISQAYYFLGRIAHLVADVTVPAHVNLDEHPIYDKYEFETARNGRFQGLTADDAIGDVRIYAGFEDLFRETADYTDDYDSDDEYGDYYGSGPTFSASRLSSLDLADRHDPSSVIRSDNESMWVSVRGGIPFPVRTMSDSEFWVLANDLMPWAIEQTAALIRLFYDQIDSTMPGEGSGSWVSNISSSESSPTQKSSDFSISIHATDPESGVDKDGYNILIQKESGGGWQNQEYVESQETTVIRSGYSPGVYRVKTEAFNGAGDKGSSGWYYFAIGDSEAPDLTATINASPELLSWGDTLSIAATTKNNGPGSAGASTAKFYMSSNSAISSTDYYLGSASVGSLSAGASQTIYRTYTLPTTPPSGFTATYDVYIGIIVDATNVVTESNESNNTNSDLIYNHIESWIPYVPTGSTISVSESGGVYNAHVFLTFPDAGYRIVDWGTAVKSGNVFTVNAKVEQWTGPSAQVITSRANDYDLGQLSAGSYSFVFKSYGSTVETKSFTVEGINKYQIVTGQNVTAPAGSPISIPVSYTVSDSDNTLTGLGLRIHYDSSKLTWTSFSSVLATAKTAQDTTPQNDTANYDGDAATDKYLQVAWADISGNWPSVSLATLLYNANFTIVSGQPIGTTTDVNFSSSSVAAGYALQASSSTVTVGQNVNLDIDGNGTVDALTDGVLVVRYMFGFTGSTLIDGAIGSGAIRTTATQITTYLDQCNQAGILDVDGNGTVDALTDGVLIVRDMFGFTGSTLTAGAIGSGATRTTATQITAFLDGWQPASVNGAAALQTASLDAVLQPASASESTFVSMPTANSLLVAQGDTSGTSASQDTPLPGTSGGLELLAEDWDLSVLSLTPALAV